MVGEERGRAKSVLTFHPRFVQKGYNKMVYGARVGPMGIYQTDITKRSMNQGWEILKRIIGEL